MKAIVTFLFWVTLSAYASAQQGAWTPNAQFLLEDANPQQTQIFVSGLSYGLTTYSQQLERAGQAKLFCLPGNGMVMSPAIYEVLNAKFKGKTITAKQATVAVMVDLQEKFPCK